MKCSNCGKRLTKELDRKTCRYCGQKVKWKRNMDIVNYFLLGFAIILIVVLLIVVYNKFIGPKFKKDEIPKITIPGTVTDERNTDMGNSLGNLSNGAIVAEDDDFTYFLTKNKKLEIKLYKQNKETLEKEVFLTGNMANFSIVDETFYYTDEAKHLIKMDLDGLEKGIPLKIGQDDEYNLSSVYGYWIYYINKDSNLSRITLNGKINEVLSEEKVKSFTILDKIIYAINEEDFIYKITISGKDEKITEEKAKQIIGHDKWIYYINDDGLYRALADSLSKEKLIDIEADSFNMDDFFIYISDGERVSYCDLEGEVLEELFEFKAKNIYILENKLYLLEKDLETLYVYNIGEEEDPSPLI